MNNSITIFLIVSVAALSFVLGAKFFPRPQASTITTITIVDAPKPVLPIQSKPGKPIPPRVDTIYVDKIIEDSTIYDFLEDYTSDFRLMDSLGQTFGTVGIISRPLQRDALLTEYEMFPMKAEQRVDSIKYPVYEYSFDYKSAIIYFGVGIITGILIEKEF